MDNKTKPKTYYIPKRLSVPAKVIGLYYNTFFIWIFLAAVFIMLGSQKGLIGFFVALVFIMASYLTLFFVQTKLGPKDLHKKINDYNNPIRFLKIKRSLKRTL